MNFAIFMSSIGALMYSLFAETHEIRGRIYNGEPAVAGQFKYIAAVVTSSSHTAPSAVRQICGGTIIASNWILTAAHCLYGNDVAKIYLGSIDRHDAVTKYLVKKNKFFPHPKYMHNHLSEALYSEYNDTLWNDIALIKIPNTEECDKIGYALLAHPATNIREGDMAFVMGWGQIGDHGRPEKRLRWAYVKIITNEMCNKLYGDIIDSDLCVKTTRPYGSHCVGDSGGPLISSDTGEVIGVASAVPKTYKGQPSGCEDGHPAIFARITTHMPWITDVTGVRGNPEAVPGVIDINE